MLLVICMYALFIITFGRLADCYFQPTGMLMLRLQKVNRKESIRLSFVEPNRIIPPTYLSTSLPN